MSTGGRDYLGPYRLVRVLRSTQTAQIWEAIDQADGKRCALKALQDKFCQDQEQIAALKAEWEVGKEINHPSVIRLYRHATDRSIPYLAMEFFTASNLKQMLRDKPDSLPVLSVGIIEQSAAGLGALHEAGWVHRDVKPDNLLVDEKGTTKLIDFSIAQPRYTGFSAFFAGFTKPSAIQGTRSYMSPEQIRNEVVDATADVYSLGCTIYELLAGKLPYTAVNPDELLNKHLKAPIPTVVAANTNVTPEFSALVARMMAKNKEQRPQSMKEFLDELAKIKVFRVRPRAVETKS